MAWKNGGGETVEIAVSPMGASLDAFDWRISMARVSSSGPFSRFPGIDRTLVILAGAGIRLSLAGRASVSLRHDTPPFSFPGDEPVEAELIDGPIDDLNTMTRRTRYRHRVARVPARAPVRLRREGDLMLVIARETAVTARIGDRQDALARGDTILLDRADGPELEIVPANPAQLYAIDLWHV